MTNIRIDNATTFTPHNLLERLIEVEEKAWSAQGNAISASAEKIRKRVVTFPEGVVIACDESKPELPVAGSQYFFRFDWDKDFSRLTSWEEATHNGNTWEVHRDDGTTGFLVGVGVVPEYRGKRVRHNLRFGEHKVSELLIAFVLDSLFDAGVERVIANARIPFYHKIGSEMGVEEYCAFRQGGKLFDPVLRFHERMGAKILKPVAYSMDDPESRNGGCWVVYERRFES